jgi:hypothetical protein
MQTNRRDKRAFVLPCARILDWLLAEVMFARPHATRSISPHSGLLKRPPPSERC